MLSLLLAINCLIFIAIYVFLLNKQSTFNKPVNFLILVTLSCLTSSYNKELSITFIEIVTYY